MFHTWCSVSCSAQRFEVVFAVVGTLWACWEERTVGMLLAVLSIAAIAGAMGAVMLNVDGVRRKKKKICCSVRENLFGVVDGFCVHCSFPSHLY